MTTETTNDLRGVAVRNLKALRKPITPTEVSKEIDRLERANQLACCRPGFLADVRWRAA